MYQKDIGKYYNMMNLIEDDTHYYRCHDGRNLYHIRSERIQQAGYERRIEVYGCEDCSGCAQKAKCLYCYDAVRDKDKNKVMKINETWIELQAESHINIQSKEGILNRQIRSIQTEGHFREFRRFHYRSEEKVRKEFMLYAMSRNINKYHRFLKGELQKYEGKPEQVAA